MGIPYAHFMPTKIPYDFIKKMCVSYNIYFWYKKPKKQTLIEGAML